MCEFDNKLLKEIIINNARIKFDLSDFDEKTDFIDDLGYDSLAMMRLITDLEDKYKFEFLDEDLNLSVIGKYGALENYIINKVFRENVYE